MSETAPTRLGVDAGGDDFPTTGSNPRLSWWPAPGPAPLGHDLEAEVDGTPAVRAEIGAEFSFVPWPGDPLSSGQQVSWRVRSSSESGASPWSAWHSFEVGLLDADWTASWISPPEGDDPGYGRRPARVLATTFEVDGDVARARLYATALGLYEAFVNGQRVGTTELAPGSTSYDRTLHAQAYDVTDLLVRGANTVELVVSDGWYRGQVGAHRRPAQWGTEVAARAELHLTDAAGATRVVGTDGQWWATASTITRADLMDGQATDQRVEPGTPRPVRVGVVDGPPISWSPAPPVRVVESRPVEALTTVSDGVQVADFGQNASGWVRLADPGPSGTRTVLEYGEHVGRDGDLTTAHLDSGGHGQETVVFVQRDEVVSDGSGEPFEPRHTVHGFRYVRLTRTAGDTDAPAIAAGSLSQQVVHTDLRSTGSFACSDPDLTRLWEVVHWSFRGNAVDVPTDCPTRERLGWTGDYQVFVSTAARLFDVHGFSRKWLTSVRDDQLDDGRIANFSPDGRQIKHHLDDQFAMMTGSAGWGDAIAHVPWTLYCEYGDLAALEENYDALVRWVDWAAGTAASARHQARIQRSAEPLAHEQYLWDGSFHWGEWCEPVPLTADGVRLDPVKTNPMGWFMADKGEVGTAFLFRSADTLARVAELLGRDEDAVRYAELARHVRDAWRTEFLGEDGRTAGDTQASYVRALAFGLVPADVVDAAASRLAELVMEADGHLATGFLATADLLPVLADHGHADLAFRVLLQRTYPSWLGMLDRGATTIWEDWDGVDADGVAHESLNHYSKGAAARFLHTHVLGLRQDDDSIAWERFTVAPVVHPTMTWAEGHLDTPRGRIFVAWAADGDDGVRVSVDVPAGASAKVELPDGRRFDAGPGRQTF